MKFREETPNLKLQFLIASSWKHSAYHSFWSYELNKGSALEYSSILSQSLSDDKPMKAETTMIFISSHIYV